MLRQHLSSSRLYMGELCFPLFIAYTTQALLYSISIGPFASLVSSPVLDLGEKDQLGRRIGILMSMVGIAMLVGAPISGAIDKSRGPIAMGLYAGTNTRNSGSCNPSEILILTTGSMMLVGAILMTIVRHMKVKSKESYWSKI